MYTKNQYSFAFINNTYNGYKFNGVLPKFQLTTDE